VDEATRPELVVDETTRPELVVDEATRPELVVDEATRPDRLARTRHESYLQCNRRSLVKMAS
jgi:hypothetical protein